MALNKISAFLKTKEWKTQESFKEAQARITPDISEEQIMPSEISQCICEKKEVSSVAPKIDRLVQSFGYYPAIFIQPSKHSYSVKLKIIGNSDVRYSLCRSCPSGRPREKFERKTKTDMARIEHRLLTANHISALFTCNNLNRCEGSIVKVVF